MAHLALYRTYRPQDFDSVIGQKHIIQTVKNQIKNDLLSHAYVLTGPRGTGKTSIARIVAKAINCSDLKNGNPCSSCESCLSVSNGNHPDVLELDGASNNGVDEIRDIRDRVKYSPSLSPYKVYIIDEVHMLSTGAFNALLKTLEEPPLHVIFLLATTEIHKVPDTILSRVQRFDLKQIPSLDMTQHLTRILDELNVKFENGVPELVATLAAGGLRDALSMLDQAIAYQSGVMKLSDIHDLNGSASARELVQVMENVIVSNFVGIVESVRGLLDSGKLPARIIDGLLSLLRDVLKVQKVGGEDATGLAEKLNAGQVLTYIKKLNSLAYELKMATDAELVLEIGLIELGFDAESEGKQTNQATTTSSEGLAASTQIPDYTLELKNLKQQVAELQAEVKKLNTRQLDLPNAARVQDQVSVNRAIQPSLVPEGELPIYIQGELVQDDVLDAPVMGVINQSVETNVLIPNVPLLIEEILANATKQDKAVLQSKVTSANAFERLEIKEVVMLFKDAEIAAASSVGCILVYDYETTAQKLFTDENQNKAHQVLAEMMGKPYGFLALPKDFWLRQRECYVVQKKQGVSPVLEQYPQTIEAQVSESTSSELEVPYYQEVIDMFGDVVEVID